MNSNTPNWLKTIPLNFQAMLPVFVSLILFAIVAFLVTSNVTQITNNVQQTNNRIFVSDFVTETSINWMDLRTKGRDVQRAETKDMDILLNQMASKVSSITSSINREFIASELTSQGEKKAMADILPMLEDYIRLLNLTVDEYKRVHNVWMNDTPVLSPTTIKTLDAMELVIDANDPNWTILRTEFISALNSYYTNISETVFSRQAVRAEQTKELRNKIQSISGAYSHYAPMNYFIANTLTSYYQTHDYLSARLIKIKSLDEQRSKIATDIRSSFDAASARNSKLMGALNQKSFANAERVNITQFISWFIAAALAIAFASYITSKLSVIAAILSRSLNAIAGYGISLKKAIINKNIISKLTTNTVQSSK